LFSSHQKICYSQGSAFWGLHSCKLRSRLIVKNENRKKQRLVESNSYNHETVGIQLAIFQQTRNPRKEIEMKKLMLLLALMMVFGQWGCEFIGGAAVGAGATGAGYEYNAYRQMQKLEEDYKAERISRQEYEKRKKQIEAGSIIY
jgi:hypothetical protein